MNKPANIVLALLLPPVGVYIRSGLSMHLAINVALCFAFFLPAVIHAVWFVTRVPAPANGAEDAEPAVPHDHGTPPNKPRERREPSLS